MTPDTTINVGLRLCDVVTAALPRHAIVSTVLRRGHDDAHGWSMDAAVFVNWKRLRKANRHLYDKLLGKTYYDASNDDDDDDESDEAGKYAVYCLPRRIGNEFSLEGPVTRGPAAWFERIFNERFELPLDAMWWDREQQSADSVRESIFERLAEQVSEVVAAWADTNVPLLMAPGITFEGLRNMTLIASRGGS